MGCLLEYQQSPPLSLMKTTHAPSKSMLPSESLSLWHQWQRVTTPTSHHDLNCKQLPLSTCITEHLILWTCTSLATCSLLPVGSSMDPRCSRSERTSRLFVHMTTIISALINLTHMHLFCLLHPNLCISLLCNHCLLTTTCSTVCSFPPWFICSSG